MYDTILIAAALFDEDRSTRMMLGKAKAMLNPGGRVVLVHVLDEVPKYAAAHVPRAQLSGHRRKVHDKLDAIAAELGDVTTEVVVRSGMASVGILGAAKEKKADVIMLASHKPGFSDYLIGSTASRVVRHAETSVLVLRELGEGAGKFRSIVIAAALFSQGSTTRRLVGKAARLLAPGGRITLVHVMEDMPALFAAAVPRERVQAHRDTLRRQLEALGSVAEGKPVEVDLRGGRPAREILQSAADNEADLIMVASHKPGLGDYFIGSTASRVVRHAPCSVLVSRRFV
jgi:universal stress protein F